MEKYGTAGEATNDNTIWHLHFACWITKAMDTSSEYVILIAFPGNNNYANTPQSYLICTLPLLFHICSTSTHYIIKQPLAILQTGCL